MGKHVRKATDIAFLDQIGVKGVYSIYQYWSMLNSPSSIIFISPIIFDRVS
jgi:hypothetical protein